MLISFFTNSKIVLYTKKKATQLFEDFIFIVKKNNKTKINK